MRPPRHRFSEQVRITTRAIASRMMQEGPVVHTEEELDAWIVRHPEVSEPLRKEGYGSAFGAPDLLPLLHAMVERSGGSVAQPTSQSAPATGGRMVLLGLLALAVVLALVAAAVLL